MSMPAETPAEVTRSPSSTSRSSGRTSIVGSSSASRSSEAQWVVAGRSLEQAGRRVDERAGADAGHQRDRGALAADPVEVGGVVELRPGALTARVDQHVERRCVRERVVRLDGQSLGAPDGLAVPGQAGRPGSRRPDRSGSTRPAPPTGPTASSSSVSGNSTMPICRVAGVVMPSANQPSAGGWLRWCSGGRWGWSSAAGRRRWLRRSSRVWCLRRWWWRQSATRLAADVGPAGQGMRWSRSARWAGCRQPGKRQVRSRARTRSASAAEGV